jgi:hypothetical protein
MFCMNAIRRGGNDKLPNFYDCHSDAADDPQKRFVGYTRNPFITKSGRYDLMSGTRTLQALSIDRLAYS